MNSLASGWPIVEIFERCSNRPGDELAWEEFVRRFHSTVRASVTKAYEHKTKDDLIRNPRSYEKAIDELVQAVYRRLIERRCHVLKAFDHDHPDSIYRYLTIVSYRVVLKHFRGVNQLTRKKDA